MKDTSALPLRPNVCIILINRKNKLFLAERNGSPGVWQFPQGGVEPDASVEENVLREIEEEIGLAPARVKIRCRLKHTHQYDYRKTPSYAQGKWRGQDQSFWLVDFLGSDDEINLDTDDQELMQWRWCTIAEVREQAEPNRLAGYEGALREIEQLLRS